jgi:glycerophosphoryl diester phosphodiesterase
MTSPLIFAHRGAREAAPENTLPAFAKALEMGADGVELDVQCSADGQLVVIHDFDVDKTTNGSGPVGGFTAAELAQLDAGSHFGDEYAGVGVPKLDQVLDLLSDRCQINVELKTNDRLGGQEVEPLLRLIQQRNLYDQVLVSSFNPIALIKMHYLDPKVRLGLLYHEPLPAFLRNAWLSPIIAPQALHPHYTLVDRELMEFARQGGYSINVWTVNDLADVQRMATLGVNVIMTDVPDQVIAALATRENY